ncbi:MAG: DMT family transporter [Hyphomicrobiaceae bacterium]
MSRSQWVLLALLSLIWGGSFLFVTVAVRELPTFTIVLVRVALAAAVLLPVVVAIGHRLPATATAWRSYAVMAILNNVLPFSLIVWSQQHITTGLASVLNATVPLWSVVLAYALGTEPLSPNRLVGVLVGIAGVAILVGPEALGGNSQGVLGMIGMLGAAFCYGVSGVWAKRFKGTPPIVSAAVQLTCATAMMVPVAALIDHPWALAMPSQAAVLALIGLGVLATALAYVMFFHIMTVSGPSNAMLVTLLIPLSAAIFGHLVLDEEILARHIVGGIVIGAALITIDGRVPSWLFQRLRVT